ncbi:poly-gamma-glutamate hydrolase family protein [Ectobacillus sp. JY-23]|uniref:poly-gamma-glutamate hydrolase family protein n=1 Tax=Ectobacillus sp. JY-23 TaxID=2933872 RepID=UPI001FF441C9|nr:poly-gamma-glutamate hydrolase family protein [Ectobacillus sp. JY-23]UOY93581.1 poly-gamma-glutamate hydrolase family protein [Ectobacillus sp. JY-23]
MHTYENFAKLAQSEVEHIDYQILCVSRNTEITVLAIHGGTIEPGTSELASDIAEALHASFYTFQGLKNNPKLHITSARFDEPRAVALVQTSSYVVSVHGAYGDTAVTYIGGNDEELKQVATANLLDAGFLVKEAPHEINGDSPKNIVNRSKKGRGLQLELTKAQRKLLQMSMQAYDAYVHAIVQAVKKVM